MFYNFYCSATFNESKEKLKIAFSYFSAIKDIALPSSFSNFPVNLIFWVIFVFDFLDELLSL